MFYKVSKKILLFAISVFLVSSAQILNAQVSINTTGVAPVASSILDMSAVSDKGILLPNVAISGTVDNTTISSPTTGLFIYNTATVSDVTPGYYYWAGTEWVRFKTTSTSYSFENGLTLSGTAAKLGGTLSENTTVAFGSGAFSNSLTFDLGNTSDFIIRNTTGLNIITTFNHNGDVDFPGNLASGEYYNFDGTFGSGGYGFRERAGDIEYKKSGGLWAPFPDAPPVGGTSYWWYKPSLTNYIRPQNSDNVRIYDSGETYGFYYNGSSNQYGGYFETASATNPTSAVVGFSNVSSSQTYGYLGYNGTYALDVSNSVDGSAVYGVVDDKNRTAVFGRTTRDANVAAIIGFSDVWMAGYYSAKDSNASSAPHPSLYGQLIVDVKKGDDGNQAAVVGYSENTSGIVYRAYSVGGEFEARGGAQNASGVEAYGYSSGAGTEAYGTYSLAKDAEETYGVFAESGTNGTTANAYGVYGKALTATGIGTVGMGSNLAHTALYSTGSGDGVVGGSDAGAGVFGYFYDGSGANSYGALGYSETYANYFYHNEENVDGNGQATIKAIRVRGVTPSPGASYNYGSTNQAIIGYNSVSDSYTFGTSGYSNASEIRSGGVFGKLYSFDVFGILGYHSSGGGGYGGYFNAGTDVGTGRSASSLSGIGVAGYGDLLGSWSRGEVYGTITKGERFAQYTDGKTYTNDLIIRLEENGNDEKIPTYVPTSMTADIYIRGTGNLVNGIATVTFDAKYQNIISLTEPVIVTVTPIGETQGLHLTELKNSGFKVAENNSGTGNIQFTWIAVAVRRGAENIENPEEVLASDFDTKLNQFLFNESVISKNAQPIWWDGTRLRYDAVPVKVERKDTSKEEKIIVKNDKKRTKFKKETKNKSLKVEIER